MDSIRIGQILKPQGIHGELKVLPLTDDPNRFLTLKQVYLEQKSLVPCDVENVSVRDGSVFMKLSNVHDRTAAEMLRNVYLCVDRTDAIQLPEGRYFIFDLIGCRVSDTSGQFLGILRDVIQNGAADVYEVEGPDGKNGFMVPALKKLLVSVDIIEKEIVVDTEVFGEVVVWDED